MRAKRTLKLRSTFFLILSSLNIQYLLSLTPPAPEIVVKAAAAGSCCCYETTISRHVLNITHIPSSCANNVREEKVPNIIWKQEIITCICLVWSFAYFILCGSEIFFIFVLTNIGHLGNPGIIRPVEELGRIIVDVLNLHDEL